MLDLVQVATPTILGRFPVFGPMNLAGAEPSGLAFNAPRGLIAAVTKPGAVHVIRLESRLAQLAPSPPARPRFAAR